MSEPKVTLYDLFDALIERVPWRTEGEMKQYRDLIQELREINLFGYMATKISVEKQFDADANTQRRLKR